MLEQREGSGQIVYYVSPLLESLNVPHAFSTRRGGVSPAPFDSLNLGIARDASLKDSPANIEANYQRLAGAIGCGEHRRAWVSQVHGREIFEIRAGDGFESGPCADGMITDDPGRILSIKYADCVPILLASGDGRVVAAVHAGWRGLVAGILMEAVRRLAVVSGGGASEFVAAVGPCISKEKFEVGPEVLTAFARIFDAGATTEHTAKGYVDLQKATVHQLLGEGLQADRIDTTDLCTYQNSEHFYSHRRDGAATGRMAALIAPVA